MKQKKQKEEIVEKEQFRCVSLLKEGVICVTVEAKPNSKVSQISEVNEEYVGVAIGAPAKEGEANQQLIRYMAEVLGVKKNIISLGKGGKSRDKMLIIEDPHLSPKLVHQKLLREAHDN